MCAAWSRLVAVSLLVGASGAAWGASYELTSSFNLQIGREDSLGNKLPLIRSTDENSDPTAAGSGDSITGLTNVGQATIRASAFAAKGFSSPEVKGPSIGVQIAGSATLTRPNNSPGGVIEAAGNAKATLKETLTFIDFIEPAATPLLRVEGYFLLTGNLSVDSNSIGNSITSFAQASYQIKSNLFQTVSEQLTSISVITPGLTKSTTIPFIALTTPSGELSVDVSIEAFGRAAVNGATFAVPGVGVANAAFNSSFEHTLSWGGITGVSNAATGAPILDWSVSSASGFDYSQSFDLPQPVPAPPALVNMLAGLALAGWTSRRSAGTRRHSTPT